MKPEHKLTSRYADLLTDPSDEALDNLVRELDTAYSAPKRPAGLSWATASQRLALVSQQTLDTGTRPRVRPWRLRTKSGRAKALLAFAAIVAVTLLSAALLTTIGASWFRQSHQAQTFPGTSSSLSAADALLLQQLLQSNGTPANIRQLAQHGQFTKVNLAANVGNVTIQEVYADTSNVVLMYTADTSTWRQAAFCSLSALRSNQCRSEPLLTVTTSEKQTLTENAELINFGKEPAGENHRVAVLAYYDASSIQGSLQQLHLTVSLSEKVSPSKAEIGRFTVPFHADKTVVTVNQTATSHGKALTLERVVITPTETRFYYNVSSLHTGLDMFVIDVKLSIAGKTYWRLPFFTTNSSSFGWIRPARVGTYDSFYDALQGQTGSWTLIKQAFEDEVQGLHPRQHYTWTFTFIVS